MTEHEQQDPIGDHQPEQQEESRIERLINELENTNKILRDTFSIRAIIIRGLLTGLAIVIGSTIVVSLLLSGAQAIFGDIPFVKNTPPYIDTFNR